MACFYNAEGYVIGSSFLFDTPETQQSTTTTTTTTTTTAKPTAAAAAAAAAGVTVAAAASKQSIDVKGYLVDDARDGLPLVHDAHHGRHVLQEVQAELLLRVGRGKRTAARQD